MDFQTSVRTCFQKYATFHGRAARSEYWWFALFNILMNAVLSAVDSIVFNASDIGILTPIYGLLVLLPAIAVSVRRLHDYDKSGWWLLIVLVPVIGWLVLLYFYIQKGTSGDNRFGSDPLGTSGDDLDKTSIPDVSDS